MQGERFFEPLLQASRSAGVNPHQLAMDLIQSSSGFLISDQIIGIG
jgi:hypothetical protein